jgi:hypothetical protein
MEVGQASTGRCPEIGTYPSARSTAVAFITALLLRPQATC